MSNTCNQFCREYSLGTKGKDISRHGKNDGNSIIAFSVKEREALATENFYGNIQDKDSIIKQLSKSIRNNISQDNGITVMIETKGNHLDGTDSKDKLECGDRWSSMAGGKFFYFMVFEDNAMEGAATVYQLISSLLQLGGN